MITSKKAPFNYEKSLKFFKDIALSSESKMGTKSIFVTIWMIIISLIDILLLITFSVYMRSALIITGASIVVISDIFYLIISTFLNYKLKYHRFYGMIYGLINVLGSILMIFELTPLFGYFVSYEYSYLVFLAYKIIVFFGLMCMIRMVRSKKYSLPNILTNASVGILCLGLFTGFYVGTFVCEGNVFKGYAKVAYSKEEDSYAASYIYSGLGKKVEIKDEIDGLSVKEIDLIGINNDAYNITILGDTPKYIRTSIKSYSNVDIVVDKNIIDQYRRNYIDTSVFNSFIPNVNDDEIYVIFNNKEHFIPSYVGLKGVAINSSFLSDYEEYYLERNNLENSYNLSRERMVLSSDIELSTLNNSTVVDFHFEDIGVISYNYSNYEGLEVLKWNSLYYFTESNQESLDFSSPKSGLDVEMEYNGSKVEISDLVDLLVNTNNYSFVLNPVLTVSNIIDNTGFSSDEYHYLDEIILNIEASHPLGFTYELYDESGNLINNDGRTTINLGVLSVSNSGNYRIVYHVVDPNCSIIKKDFEKILPLNILKKNVKRPDYVLPFFTYTGEIQTFVKEESEYYTIENNTGLLAGNYVVTIRLIDSDNFTFSDEDFSILNYTYTIRKAVVEFPAIEKFIFEYNGQFQDFGIVDSFYYTKDLSGGKDAGKYTVTLSLNDKDNYMWSNELSLDMVYEFQVEKMKVSIPVVEDNVFIYNGELKELDIPESIYYSISGNNAIEVGTYEALVTLNDNNNYCWDDLSNDVLKFEFEIVEGE